MVKALECYDGLDRWWVHMTLVSRKPRPLSVADSTWQNAAIRDVSFHRENRVKLGVSKHGQHAKILRLERNPVSGTWPGRDK